MEQPLPGALVRIEGLQTATQHNGRNAWVVGAVDGTIDGTNDDATAASAPGDARVCVRLVGDGGTADVSGPTLRVRPANLRPAYVPEANALVCAGGSAQAALAAVMARFPAGATAVVHYSRDEQSREELRRTHQARLFRGNFDFADGRCSTLPRAQFKQATSKCCALHVRVCDVPNDGVELILFARPAATDAARQWRDGGLPRELWRLPCNVSARKRALDTLSEGGGTGIIALLADFLAHGRDEPTTFTFREALNFALCY
ncbi:hypothetical protein KFE25_014177 [Diacronema lutheri]|uniref:Uncharacterized protein n=1 Tax=Diacronema lutheri TaxID=2081491 RepID=A0A8J5XAX1_DIALT|nr:hypothetical protein KFE25_014177 [Diacronema lutheri]